jgi:hypothetical protein
MIILLSKDYIIKKVKMSTEIFAEMTLFYGIIFDNGTENKYDEFMELEIDDRLEKLSTLIRGTDNNALFVGYVLSSKPIFDKTYVMNKTNRLFYDKIVPISIIRLFKNEFPDIKARKYATITNCDATHLVKCSIMTGVKIEILNYPAYRVYFDFLDNHDDIFHVKKYSRSKIYNKLDDYKQSIFPKDIWLIITGYLDEFVCSDFTLVADNMSNYEKFHLFFGVTINETMRQEYNYVTPKYLHEMYKNLTQKYKHKNIIINFEKVEEFLRRYDSKIEFKVHREVLTVNVEDMCYCCT